MDLKLNGKLKTSKKREKVLTAVADLLDELLGTDISEVYLNENKYEEGKIYSVSFVCNGKK